MKITKWTVITVVSLVLFVLALFFLNKGIDFVIAASASIFLHELAHGIMVSTTGLKFNMVFIPLLGAGVIPSDTTKYLSLPIYKQATIAIAGPLLNALLLLIGLFLSSNTPLVSLGHQFVVINIILIVFNITPIGPFDGSKVASAMLKSITNWWIKIPLAIYFMAVSLISLYFFFSPSDGTLSTPWLITIIILSFLGIISKLLPSKSEIPTVMTKNQSRVTFFLYFLLASLNFVAIFNYLLSSTRLL